MQLFQVQLALGKPDPFLPGDLPEHLSEGCEQLLLLRRVNRRPLHVGVPGEVGLLHLQKGRLSQGRQLLLGKAAPVVKKVFKPFVLVQVRVHQARKFGLQGRLRHRLLRETPAKRHGWRLRALLQLGLARRLLLLPFCLDLLALLRCDSFQVGISL